jgi:hypothetical protein
MFLAGVTVPTTAEAQDSCNGLINLQYVSGLPYGVAGDTYRVQVSLGTGTIQGGTAMTIDQFRFELDCTIFGFVGCFDEGDIIRYVSDATITDSNCLDAGLNDVTWTSNGVDSPVGPNEVIFTPSAPVVIGPNVQPVNGCVVEFDVRVQTQPGVDASPLIVQQAAGYVLNGPPYDANCDNGLSSTAGQSGQINLCPTCVNDQCFTQACNQQTGMCEQTNEQLSEPCEADGDLCTNDHCDGNGTCVFLNNVMCQAANPPCEGGEICNPMTGVCDPQPDGALSLPCEADGNLCTIDHCDGNGMCVQFNTVMCQPANPPCEGGQMCDPQSGMCVNQPDAMLSTPCDLDANACTVDHCDGNGMCVFLNNVMCQPANPPCEGGQMCDPQSGMCVNQPDAMLSTPCDLDANACTTDHCNGAGMCVFLSNVMCQAANPPCEGGEVCNPQSGMCDPQPDGALSLPCEADGNLCTTDHCNGSGLCVFLNNVTCPGPTPPCEGGQVCDPQSGMCVDQPDPSLSTPCDLDANGCTTDHCDGNGTCVFLSNVVCPGPTPPCEGGQVCNPQSGMCEDQPDAQVSTPCEADSDPCSIDHCDGAGECVFQMSSDDPECGGDHYKCYKTGQQPPRFQQQIVTLIDQFKESTTTVVRPTRFCNPVDKNGEGIEDPTAHLLCYKVKEPPMAPVDVIVNNQFGEQALTVTRVEQLCVPAEKNGEQSELNINHFKCYKVKPTPGSPGFQEEIVSLADQFEIKNTRIIKPRFLCNPVQKNDEPIVNAGGHLTCYRIKDVPGQPKFTGEEITALDQFGEAGLGTFTGDCSKASFVCVPSGKRLASPSGAFLEMTSGMLD